MAQAAQGDKDRPGFGQRQVDPDKAAERLAEVFGIDKATVLDHYNNGVKFRDIGRAAFLAKASGKTLDDVLALKTADNKWRDVAKTLGITKEQAKATHRALTADRLSAKLGFDRQATLGLLDNGYRPRDVAVAGLLAGNTGKTSQEILDMKKINNTWRDVADSPRRIQGHHETGYAKAPPGVRPPRARRPSRPPAHDVKTKDLRCREGLFFCRQLT